MNPYDPEGLDYPTVHSRWYRGDRYKVVFSASFQNIQDLIAASQGRPCVGEVEKTLDECRFIRWLQ